MMSMMNCLKEFNLAKLTLINRRSPSIYLIYLKKHSQFVTEKKRSLLLRGDRAFLAWYDIQKKSSRLDLIKLGVIS